MGKIKSGWRRSGQIRPSGESAGPIFIAAHLSALADDKESTVESTGLIWLVNLRIQLYIGFGLDSHIARPRHGGCKPTVQPWRKHGIVFATSLAPESSIAATGLIKSIDIE